jgi:hypothetical protein
METQKARSKDEQEVDLGVFFNVIGKLFQKLFLSLKILFTALFNFFIATLILIKRNWIILLVAAFAGLIGGYYILSQRTGYSSEMILKTNFKSSRLLYQKINLLNALLKQENYHELSNVLNMNEADVKHLTSIEIEPIKDALESALLYKNVFIDYKSNNSTWADTTWAKSFKYKDFEDKWEDFDYPLHRVKVNSHSALINPSIQKSIIQSVNENETIQYSKKITLDNLKQQETILVNSLAELDSLRQAYIHKINQEANKTGNEGNNILLTQAAPRSPELDLFDKELGIKNELAVVKQKQIDLMDVIQVYADLNPIGTKKSIISGVLFQYVLYAVGFAFLMIILVLFIKYLNAVDIKKRKSAGSVGSTLL